MLRLLVALHLFFLSLYACQDGLDSCRQKVVDSESIVEQTVQIPLKNNQRLVFSATPPNAKIIKHDSYLSLYLIEDEKKFKYPFLINMNVALGLIGVDNKRVVEGKIVKKQIGLNTLATFSEPLSAPSLLLNSCCVLEGIVTERGIIEKEYIERFLKTKEVSYGDIGIRVKDENGAVVVTSSNPFIQGNLIQVGDIVLEFDGKKVKESAQLMRDILFSPIGSKHTLKVKRADKVAVHKAATQKRAGGGYKADVFLEFLGLSFDKNLQIINIERHAARYGLKTGDRLMQINKKDLRAYDDIFTQINKPKNEVNLLFERENFQFFVKLN
ncbi:MAG: PDZ domain-containing protein [Sulfurimonas sp.]|uniref:DUF7488 domain-containing protein n=1 Tax=Sulfurimonas sp. TaxID=2022749 RepID=UPI00260C58B9|nr:PDZ domain-containing protein [Sulfurimonas sp.]MDD2652093.1 PDZ domain-containing protein [Sulfurimonas sp.]MDD3451997.1 PDZ domain-containing protein [Sulfurimonas sp.]